MLVVVVGMAFILDGTSEKVFFDFFFQTQTNINTGASFSELSINISIMVAFE